MTETKTGVSELSIIPGWARVLAAIVVAAALLAWGFFGWAVPMDEPEVRGVHFFFFGVALLAGSLLAVVVLLTGYVNQDARRRGMSAALWTLLVLVIPNGIGFLVYFLVRQPLRALCPQCSERIPPGSSYCSKCGSKVAPTCPHCDGGISADYAHCPHCGKALAGRVAS